MMRVPEVEDRTPFRGLPLAGRTGRATVGSGSLALVLAALGACGRRLAASLSHLIRFAGASG